MFPATRGNCAVMLCTPAHYTKTGDQTMSAKKKNAASKSAKSTSDTKFKQLSAIDAAAKVLGESKEPLNCKQIVDAMGAKGYWTSPGGKTPHATLYSAILREIKARGKEARFKKTERGRFTLAG